MLVSNDIHHNSKIKVALCDLPLFCPSDQQLLFNRHPRIFLAISGEQQEVMCRYCGTSYILEA